MAVNDIKVVRENAGATYDEVVLVPSMLVKHYAPTGVEFGNTEQEYDISGTTWVTASAGGTLGGIPNEGTANHALADVITAISTSRDNAFLSVRELTGAASATNPATVHFLFSGVSNFSSVNIRYFYFGTTQHNVNVQLWNYNTNQWDTYLSFSKTADFVSSTIEIFNPALYISGGAVKLQFIHTTIGIATHYYEFDYVALVDGGGGSGGASSAASIPFIPTGNIDAINVQNAIEELDTEKQASLTFGIADTNKVQINAAEDVADNDYAKFTATGLEGRSYSEVLSDIGAQAAYNEITVNLGSAGWAASEQSETISGLTATSDIMVFPPVARAAYLAYGAAQISATAVGTDSITFTCTTDPTGDIDNVIVLWK